MSLSKTRQRPKRINQLKKDFIANIHDADLISHLMSGYRKLTSNNQNKLHAAIMAMKPTV